MKALFITPHRIDAASSRYRVYQYLPYLQSHGVEIEVRPFVDSAEFFDLVYRAGHVGRKALYTLRSYARRWLDLIDLKDFDLVFVHKESLPYGPAIFERAAAARLPLVFDFDDAIYLPNTSQANRWLSWLKQPGKTAEIIHLSRAVIAGNAVLQSYAFQFNPVVHVIPTPIDTTLYTPRPTPRAQSEIVIGWMGSHSTQPYLHLLDGALQTLHQRYKLQVRVIGGEYALPGVNVVCRPWQLENELSDLHGFDIGVMPMPDNPWTQSKCGFKALQYMAAGLPAAASPVGVNREIIQDGQNGLLANSEAEWVAALTELIENPSRRQALGESGRATVEARYSLNIHAPRMLEILQAARRAN